MVIDPHSRSYKGYGRWQVKRSLYQFMHQGNCSRNRMLNAEQRNPNALDVHLSNQCQVPARVPPNTSVGHQGPPFSQGSKRIRHHSNPSEVIKGTPEGS
ncbi:hypothetical protein V6N13_055599 [Hibiscus sabdariffa]|uniref:Uncharacterized protein n=1 Tax=Hibiscus sabdariffa TaxID=183260 RepID=A0ABR2BLV9_9ROSI